MSVAMVARIAQNELRRLTRERALVIFGLALPVVIIVLVGSTFGTTGAIHLGVLDQDGSRSSASMVERLDATKGIDLKEVGTARALRRDVRSTALSAGLVVPAGYGAALAEGHATVDVVVDPSSSAVASALAAIQAAVDQEGVVQGAEQLVAGGGTSMGDARRQVAEAATRLEPVVARDAVDRSHEEVGSYSYTAPGNLVLFVFIMTFAVSTGLANDRKQGLIARMLVTPNRPATVLGGIGLAKLAFSLLQSLLILGVGSLLFAVRWGDPLAAGALVLVFAALATAVGLIVGASVRDADQAQSIGIPLAVGMGMLGGCMWPLSIVPDAMRVAGHVVPHAWAMDAWEELVFDGAGLRDVLPNLAVLAGMALVLSLIAVRRLRTRVIG